jgi:hypothetical protein
MTEMLKGWSKVKNFDEEDVYYLKAEISIPLHGLAMRDIQKEAVIKYRAELSEKVRGLMVPIRLDAGLTSDYVITASITIDKVLAIIGGEK